MLSPLARSCRAALIQPSRVSPVRALLSLPHFRRPSLGSRFLSSSAPLILDPPYDPSLPLPPFAPPIQRWVRPYTPGPLTPPQLSQFYEWGYVIIPNLLTPSDLQPTMSAISQQVDDIARALHSAGRLTSLCEDEDFFHRLTRLEQQVPSLSVLLHKQGKLPVPMYQLWSHPLLMGIAHQVLGPNVSAHPNWSLRSKTPQEEQGTVPWHQDAAYLQPDADETLQMTAWIPFLDTNVTNGCMQVIRGGHRVGRLIPHVGCSGRTWYIEMDPNHLPSLSLPISTHTITVPVPFGSVVLLNNLIPHRSLPNLSNDIRWSVDVRWQDSQKPSGFPAKPLLELSRGSDPGFKPDWRVWAEQDRHVLVKSQVKAKEALEEEEGDKDPFDTTIVNHQAQPRHA